MKTLLMLRHAKSSWSDAMLPDYERPLNKRGKQDAPRMGKLLRAEDLVPDLIITSSAVRAVATAAAVAEACGYEHDLQETRKLYHADPETYIDVLNDVPDRCELVMIVGHNPGLEDLLEDLTDEWERLPTASLAQITLPIESWRDLIDDTPGKLVQVWRPKELAAQ